MDVDVLGYISALKQGNIKKAAELSFDCIQCGLCASRCMGEIPQYHIAQLARRVYGRYIQPQAEHLKSTGRRRSNPANTTHAAGTVCDEQGRT